MKAARIHRFGGPDVIQIDEVACPRPGAGQVFVRVANAGVGPWDAWIREQKSVVRPPLPVTLGSDLSGTVEALGPDGARFALGDEVYGVTNPEFVGAYSEFAVAQANRIAVKPKSLTFEQAASAPVVAVTAWQMLFDYAKARPGQTVLIHGGRGNVGAYAVQLAHHAGLHVVATAAPEDETFVKNIGADIVINFKQQRFEEVAPRVDIVLDTVGGETQDRSWGLLKQGGILVSIVSNPTPPAGLTGKVRPVFFLVDVTAERLETLGQLFDSNQLVTQVGSVLPLEEARTAHEMLAGAPHKPGKIVLRIVELA